MSRMLIFELKYDIQSHKVFILEPVIGVSKSMKMTKYFRNSVSKRKLRSIWKGGASKM